MVRTYLRKTQRSSYTKEKLAEAIDDIKSGRLNPYRASKKHNIPLNTILDRIKGRRGVKSKSLGRGTAIAYDEEKRLANGLLMMEKYGFGLSRKEVLQLVGQFVTANKLKTPFKHGTPGEDWFLGFSKRHNLSIKKPQSVEVARKNSCNPFIIDGYLTLLETTLRELGLEDRPQNIWNLDETSFCTDPSKTKIVGGKNLPCTRTTSAPGRENITVLMAASAAGDKVPPLIIFKGKNIWDQWHAPENTGYPGTTYAATTNGWMEVEVFENYFEKSFLKAVGNDRPVLLIYDGHSTHLSIKLIETAVRENITILKLPPHTSHVLQPLDLAVFKPLKTSWDQELVKWQRHHPGVKLPKREFSRLIGEIWRNLSKDVIQNGFQKGGISPFSRNIIPESMYDPICLKKWKECKVKTPETTNTNPIQVEDDPMILLIEEAAENPLIIIENSLTEDGIEPGEKNVLVDYHISLAADDLTSPSKDIQNDQVRRVADVLPSVNNQQENNGVHSFEELLLATLKASKQNLNKKKRKIAAGSEVITAEEVVERLKNENILKQKNDIKKTKSTKDGRAKKNNLKNKKNLGKNLKMQNLQDKQSKTSEGSPDLSSDSDVPLSTIATCSKKKDDNLCSICQCDFRCYFNKNEWIQCVVCMEWVCGICNKGSKNPQYECQRCYDDD